jgi:dTDP-4-dehydrorhamnose reductase
MRVFVLGASGMIGSAIFNHLAADDNFESVGSLRDEVALRLFPSFSADDFCFLNILDNQQVQEALNRIHPDFVINCVGVVKQSQNSASPLKVLPINSLFPLHLADLCEQQGSHLIQISTDCVFDGKEGNYKEDDPPSASDLYGISKMLGEISDKDHVLTLRTSFIGHELNGVRSHGLLEWFLAQSKSVLGYSRATFSGLPTIEFAQVLVKHVLSSEPLSGLYHVASDPIDKLSLLRLIAKKYGKALDIVPDDTLQVNRSLCGEKFHNATGYTAPPWADLVDSLHGDYLLQTN